MRHLEQQDGSSYVGEMRGCGTVEAEQWVRTKDSCPTCGNSLYEIFGFRDRVIVTRVVDTGTIEVEDIPQEQRILACLRCRTNFTTKE